MTGIKQYEPLWGSWYVESLLGKGGFGKVYKVKKEEFGKSYHSAVKILSIPQDEADLRQARSEGLDETSVRSYFHTFVLDILQEVDFMSVFRGNSNFVSLEDHKVIEKENEIGWDILIRMELLTSLSEHVTEHPLTPDDVVKLGIHLCRALELCALRKTIHRDIKPDNIFVSQYGEYKLGDFGIARQIERTLSGLSKKGTENYMAPEVFKGEEYGASVDLYSLGIVMYRYLNQNRLPFLPAFPNPVMPHDREEARQRRMKGEALLPLDGIDPALNEIVLRACAFDPRARFGGATEMKEALEALARSGTRSVILEYPKERKEAPKREAADDFSITEKTQGVFAGLAGPLEREKTDVREKPGASQAEAPLATVRKLAMLSGLFFGLLGILCWPGGLGAALIFLPLYALCASQCALRFRNRYMNAFFLSALVFYVSYSFFFAFEIFDYPLFIMTWSLLALESVRNRSKNALICSVLTAFSLASAFMAVRALYGISAGTYHVYVSGAMAVPFLMLFIALTGPFMAREKFSRTACAALIAVQFFPAVAMALEAAMEIFAEFSKVSISHNDTLSFIANASFARISGGAWLPFPVWRFGVALVQIFAFTPFFMLSLSQMTPSLFMRVCAKENRKKCAFTILLFFVAFMIATKAVSVIPGYILAVRGR